MAKKTIQPNKLVLDAGNGNIKVVLNDESEVIPATYRKEKSNFVRGGFCLNETEEYVIGWSNWNNVKAKAVIAQDNGKVELLPVLISGAIAAMEHTLRTDKDDYLPIDLYLVTLNPNLWSVLEEKVASINSIGIDGRVYKPTIILKNIYPEGYGAALSIKESATKTAVLDIGNGTLNISEYFNGSGTPRFQSYDYRPVGVSSYLEILTELFRTKTSNGRVNDRLLLDALVSNTYLYLNSYKGTDIRDLADEAATIWLENSMVKDFLVYVAGLMKKDIPVIGIGGGMGIDILRDKVTYVLNEASLGGTLILPKDPVLLGVSGIASSL